jgi:hypothetical protein
MHFFRETQNSFAGAPAAGASFCRVSSWSLLLVPHGAYCWQLRAGTPVSGGGPPHQSSCMLYTLRFSAIAPNRRTAGIALPSERRTAGAPAAAFMQSSARCFGSPNRRHAGPLALTKISLFFGDTHYSKVTIKRAG